MKTDNVDSSGYSDLKPSTRFTYRMLKALGTRPSDNQHGRLFTGIDSLKVADHYGNHYLWSNLEIPYPSIEVYEIGGQNKGGLLSLVYQELEGHPELQIEANGYAFLFFGINRYPIGHVHVDTTWIRLFRALRNIVIQNEVVN